MEKLKNFNLHFDDPQNIIKSICWILSYLSWLLLTINSWVSFGWLYREKYMKIWTIKVVTDFNEHIYLPLNNIGNSNTSSINWVSIAS